jgi:hypothetical protein
MMQGTQNTYSVEGILMLTEYFENDVSLFSVYYDTAGIALDTVYDKPGKRILTHNIVKTAQSK